MSEFDWMDGGSARAVVPAKPPADPRLVRLVQGARKLPVRHRLLLKALAEHQFRQAPALRALKAQGIVIERHTAAKWAAKPAFKALVDQWGDIVLAGAGTDRTSILLSFAKLVDYGMEDKPIFDSDGLRIDTEMRNPELAMAANDKLAKAARVYGEDAEKSRVTVVLDFTGEKPAIDANSVEAEDAEFTEIGK